MACVDCQQDLAKKVKDSRPVGDTITDYLLSVGKAVKEDSRLCNKCRLTIIESEN